MSVTLGALMLWTPMPNSIKPTTHNLNTIKEPPLPGRKGENPSKGGSNPLGNRERLFPEIYAPRVKRVSANAAMLAAAVAL